MKRGEFVFSTWYNPQSNEVLIDNSTIRWVDSPTGPIQIYQEPAPGEAYVIGADTAGEGSDFNVGQVVCHGSGRQVCTIRGQMDEDLFAKQLYCLGVTYNTALIAIEANFSSYPIRELERLRYPGSTCARRRTASPTARGRATALKPAASPGPWSSPGWWRWSGSMQSGSATKTR